MPPIAHERIFILSDINLTVSLSKSILTSYLYYTSNRHSFIYYVKPNEFITMD